MSFLSGVCLAGAFYKAVFLLRNESLLFVINFYRYGNRAGPYNDGRVYGSLTVYDEPTSDRGTTGAELMGPNLRNEWKG